MNNPISPRALLRKEMLRRAAYCIGALLIATAPVASTTAQHASAQNRMPLSPRPKTAIVIHTTASDWGNVAAVASWHRGRGWSTIGYQRLITNYYPTYADRRAKRHRKEWDGRISYGRTPDTSIGAHTKEKHMNLTAIGVAVVGDFDSGRPTARQIHALIHLCATLCRRHKIDSSRIDFHRDYANKSCPGTLFPSRARIRRAVRAEILRRNHRNAR